MNTLHFAYKGAQGEIVAIVPIDRLPENPGSLIVPVNGKLIVGHSESGHHHVIDSDCATATRLDEFFSYVTVSRPTQIDHLREHDTHPSIALQPGMYEFRTGREFDPFHEAIRASAD